MRGGLMAAVGAGALLTGAMANAAETLTEALVKTYAGNPTIMAQRAPKSWRW